MQQLQCDHGRQPVEHLPQSYEQWIRSADISNRKVVQEEKVYQVEKISPGDSRPLVICSTSKSSAKKLIAALSQRDSADRYRVVCYLHPALPGFER